MSKHERKYLLAGALVLLAIILAIGGVMYYRSMVQPANQAMYDAVMTRASAAGQTAAHDSNP